METYNTLILSFYRALKEDVQSLLPESDLEEDWKILLDEFTSYEGVQHLCRLGKEMEICLITDKLLDVPSEFPRHEGSNLPELFYELFQTIFHESGLRRYTSNSVGAKVASATVLVLRQILLAFSKLEDVLPNTDPESEIRSFISRIQTAGLSAFPPSDNQVIQVAHCLLSQYFGEWNRGEFLLGADFQQWEDNPFGRHGPGAVAGRERGVSKYQFSHISGIPEDIYFIDSETGPMRLRGVVNAQSRACLVPKDFRGRRIICIEPKELMFAQQGLMQVMFQRAHSWHVTRRSINFLDQRASQIMCRQSRYSTIDLKDASDSVSLDLLRQILPRRVFKLLTRYRSRSIETPVGVVDNYSTAFTMGNALCFPVETIVFWALSLAAIIVCESHGSMDAMLTTHDMLADSQHANWRRFRLRVFGDDIIVPSRFYDEVCRVLTVFGMKVNTSKSCHKTPVREACGAYWYAGYDVRVVRFRTSKGKNHRSWISWADNARALLSDGFHKASLSICEHMSHIAPVPYGCLGLPGQRDLDASLYRYNPSLQRVEVRIPTLVGPRLRNLPGGIGLYSYFTGSATKALTHGGASSRVKWVWTGLY